MKAHSTNYFDTFIEVSEDTKAICGTIPPAKANKSVAEMQYELIASNPYRYTSDDVFFQVFAERKELAPADYEQGRAAFFSKGQPCFRASPLPKTYGFGVHSNHEGKVALVRMESEKYQQLLADSSIKKVKAMKSAK